MIKGCTVGQTLPGHSFRGVYVEFVSNVNFYKQINIRGCIQKFPDWVDNEIYAYNVKHSLRSNTKGYGGKTH
jgi:hypothetical protein